MVGIIGGTRVGDLVEELVDSVQVGLSEPEAEGQQRRGIVSTSRKARDGVFHEEYRVRGWACQW